MEHFSPSQLDMLLNKCAIQWNFRYQQGLIIPPAAAALVGTGTHAGIEYNLKHYMLTGEPAPVEHVLETARDALNESWDKGVRLLPEEQKEGEATIKGSAVDKVVHATQLHHSEVAPTLNPIDVERSWEIAIPGFPRTVRGRIDIEEPRGLRDTKTSGKSPAADLIDRHSQLTWYALALQAIDGQPPDYVALDYLVIGQRDAKYKTLKSTRDEHDFRREIARLEVACQLVEKQIFAPADPTSWVCSPKWCGYWNRCRHGAKKSTTVSYAVSGRDAPAVDEDPVSE